MSFVVDLNTQINWVYIRWSSFRPFDIDIIEFKYKLLPKQNF